MAAPERWAGGNTLALRALGAAVFRSGWATTWAALWRIDRLDTELAGADHHDAGDCWEQLTAGQLLTLVREPANRHDALAVRVDCAHGVLGYVPRLRNRRIAQALDNGLALQVRLTGLSDRYEWRLRLRVRIKCLHLFFDK